MDIRSLIQRVIIEYEITRHNIEKGMHLALYQQV